MLAAIVLLAVLPASLAKFALPIDKISESIHGANWDITYRMANLAGPIAICDNPTISTAKDGIITQEIASQSAPEAQLVTGEYTAKGFWIWINSSGWDADSVSFDLGNAVIELGSTHGEVSDQSNSVYGCSVEPHCEFTSNNPCNIDQTQLNNAYCTLFVCMFTAYGGDAGRSKAKSRREASFLPVVEGLPAAPVAPKAKSLSLRDTYPRNVTSYYNYLAQLNIRLQLASNKDQEDMARMILDHFQCDAFLDTKANLESIPWDSVPTYKERNIDLMRRRSQLKPLFERVFVIDESEMSEEEKPTYREDTVVRLLQSVHRYATFIKMRIERVGCAYIPQCASPSAQEFPLAVMVCVTVQPYSGPTPPPVRRTTVITQTTPQAATVSVDSGASAEPTTTVVPTETTIASETVTEPAEPAEAVEPSEAEPVDPAMIEDMNNQKVKV